MKSIVTKLVLALVFGFGARISVSASEYLTDSEVATVSVATAGASLAGMRIREVSPNRAPLIRGHIPFERSFQRWLGGEYSFRKSSNFLDSKFGAFITPLSSGVILSALNLTYPRDDRSKDFSEDLFLFISGALATKGVTDITKGVFARERPLVHAIDDNTEARATYGSSYLQHSFFSGHASGAFFSASFLNLRVRETMRRRMTSSEYQNYRWVSSTALFGWATFVGLSRVHAYKHHLSDVIVGGAAGILVAELFFSFSKKVSASDGYSPTPQFRISIPF